MAGFCSSETALREDIMFLSCFSINVNKGHDLASLSNTARRIIIGKISKFSFLVDGPTSQFTQELFALLVHPFDVNFLPSRHFPLAQTRTDDVNVIPNQFHQFQSLCDLLEVLEFWDLHLVNARGFLDACQLFLELHHFVVHLVQFSINVRAFRAKRGSIEVKFFSRDRRLIRLSRYGRFNSYRLS